MGDFYALLKVDGGKTVFDGYSFKKAKTEMVQRDVERKEGFLPNCWNTISKSNFYFLEEVNMKSKLISKKYALSHKKDISKTFGCVEFEPKLCCLCQEVERFINELSEKEHDLMICQNE